MKKQGKLVVTLMLWGLLGFFVFSAAEPVAEAGPIWGFADLHNHQFSNLGFGGNLVFGAPYADLSAADEGDEMSYALPWCTSSHGPGGVWDLIDTLEGYGTVGHPVGGWPQFDGWPRWNSVTHQQVYYEWLKRAFDGGLKLMVMHAVSNELLCELQGARPGFTCNDMDAVDAQLQWAHSLEAYIDKLSGGPGLGWYRIVTSSEEARQFIESGKMAIVLGMEVDNLFNCKVNSGCTPQYVEDRLDYYYNKGVRHIFPIHAFNNGFGGPALYVDLFNFGNKIIEGDFFQPKDCYSDGYEFKLSGLSGIPILANLLLPDYQGNAHCNQLGLTNLGKWLIQLMIDRKMIIDIDHMSLQAVNDTLDIVEKQDYPVVSGHTGLLGISLGEKRSEAQKSDALLERIRGVGGLVAPILHQGKRAEIAQAPGSPVPHDCGNSSRSWAQAYLYTVQRMGGGAVAMGSDFNGIVKQPAPRFGPDACDGDQDGPQDPATKIIYPFMTETGVSMTQSQAGQRVFDYNVDGLAHVGMLPDFIQDLKVSGLKDEDLEPLFRSAEAYVHLWEKIEAANLKISQVGSYSASVEAGGSFTAHALTVNVGSKRAVPSMTRFYLSPDPAVTNSAVIVGQQIVPELFPSLGIDIETTVSLPYSVATGTYYLLACADEYGEVFESNEKDNCLNDQNTIEIKPSPVRQCFKDADGDGYRVNAPDWAPVCGYLMDKEIDCNDNDPLTHLCEPIEIDRTPPARTDGWPSGSLSPGALAITLSLSTDETGTCRYATTSGVPYATMTGIFETTGGTNHTQALKLLHSSQTTFRYYVRCSDGFNANTDDYLITFNRPAPEYTLTVDSSDDEGDANIGDGLCATTSGKCTLRAAIQEANAVPGVGTSIKLPAGTYTLAKAGAGEDNGANGDLDITAGTVIIAGEGADSTIIDGNGGDRIFHILPGVTATVSQVTIRNGAAAGGAGGCLANYGILKLADATIRGCSAAFGGGIYNEATAEITNTAIIGNTAGYGGGIYTKLGAVTVNSSTLSGNSASDLGGGVLNAGALNITNSTLSGNTADFAGAISNATSSSTLMLLNCTVAGNIAGTYASALYNEGGASLWNTIVTRDPAVSSSDNCMNINSGTLKSKGHNLSSDNSCSLTDPSDLSSTDPLLGPLANNGSRLQTHALLSGSPAIDSVDDTVCPEVDERGMSRPQDGNEDETAVCDRGAYEFVIHETYTLTVAKGGTGTGEVASDTGALVWNRNTGTATYDKGATVTLTAMPSAWSAFAGWTADACSGTGPCTVRMNGNINMKAHFVSAPLNKDQIAYWSLDRCDAADDSGNGQNGMVYGGSCVNGESGKAFDLTGNAYISIPDSPFQQIATNQLTLYAWVFLNDNVPSTQARLINKQSAPETAWGLDFK